MRRRQAIGAFLVGTLLGLAATPVLAEPDATPARTAGADRIETAAQLVDAAETVVLARADEFPDALSASGLAGAVGDAVLLTAPDHLSPDTAAALERLAAQRVVLLGGESAISGAVEDELLRAGYATERVAGADRYETAANAARRVGATDLVFVVSGERFADALAVGAPAFAGPHPILLTAPDALPAPTAAVLDELAPAHAVILGGTGVVSDAVVAELAGRGLATTRIAGADRADTAARLADWWETARGTPATRAVVVRGDAYPDALAAGPFAGQQGAPILLAAAPATLGPAAAGWLAGRCGQIDAVLAIGGETAITPTVLDAALRAIRVCDAAVAAHFTYGIAAEPDTGVDHDTFVAEVAGIIGDPRGWTEPGRLTFGVAAEGHDLVVRLVDDATGRDGRDLDINVDAWLAAAADERARIVNDLLSHGLGSGHLAEGPWPSSVERAAVLNRYAPLVTVAFAGDVHGEGVVGTELRAGRNPLTEIAPVLRAADIAVVNLETAVGSSGRPADKTFTFQAPPELVTALADAGVDVVTLANNHGLDYGVEALLETIDLAEAAGLAVVGAGRNAEEAYAPALLRVGDASVAVVGLSRVLSAGWAATVNGPGMASAYDEAAATSAVRAAAAQADHVVVTIHWGAELAECPNADQLRLADALTAAGADVIAGHHPHILQGIEPRDDALVAYSLGNFVWYHSRAPSRFTGVLTATLPGADHTFTPAEIDTRGHPRPLDGAAAAAVAATVAARSPGGGRCSF